MNCTACLSDCPLESNSTGGSMFNLSGVNMTGDFNKTDMLAKMAVGADYINSIKIIFENPSTELLILLIANGVIGLVMLVLLFMRARQIKKAPRSMSLRGTYLVIIEVHMFVIVSCVCSLFAWGAAAMFSLLRALSFTGLCAGYLDLLHCLATDHTNEDPDSGFDLAKVVPVEPAEAWGDEKEGEGCADVKDAAALAKGKLTCWGMFMVMFRRYEIRLGLLAIEQALITVPLIEVAANYVTSLYGEPDFDIKSFCKALSVMFTLLVMISVNKAFRVRIDERWDIGWKSSSIAIIMFAIGVQPFIMALVESHLIFPPFSPAITRILWENTIINFECFVASVCVLRGFEFHDFELAAGAFHEKTATMVKK